MRLTNMTRLALAAALLALTASVPSHAFAQNSVPPGQGNKFKDTSPIKPPAGARVAIYEFEDLECPACSHAFPIVHAAVAKYNIPLVRHDFPLPMHVWSRNAAVIARYLQDKSSPKDAEDYRRDVFANQNAISTKDDLENYSRKWFQQHGKSMPFVLDPQFAAEVQADYALGERIGLSQTPTIFVVTPKGWTQIMDVSLLYQTIDAALAANPAAATPQNRLKKSPTTRN